MIDLISTLGLISGMGRSLHCQSWKPRANKKSVLFLSCITKMGKIFIKFFYE